MFNNLREIARRFPRSKLNEALSTAPSRGGATAVQQRQGTKSSRRLKLSELDSLCVALRLAFRLAGLNRFRVTWRKILRILEVSYEHPAIYLPQLKAAAHECRRYYIEGGQLDRSKVGPLISGASYWYVMRHREAAMQLSYLGRTLPKKKVSEKLFTEYVNVLTSESPQIPVELEFEIQRWARRFNRKRSKIHPTYGGLSSCTEYTRREGGLYRAIGDLCEIRDSFPGERIKHVRRPYGPRFPREIPYATGVLSDKRQADLISIAQCMREASKKHPSYHGPGCKPFGVVEPVGVPEFGYKLRWVTKSPASLTFEGHLYRAAFYPVLNQYRVCREPLKGVESFYVGRRLGYLVFSSDLTSATDLVSREALQIICREWNIPERNLTDHQIWWKGKTFQQRRGSLMGLPVSWVSLSLIHMAIADRVCRRFRLSRVSYRLKGDDLLAYWPASAIEAYKVMMTQLGFRVNDKKSFVSKTRGLFCEKPYHLSQKDDGVYLERTQGFHSLRWALDKSPKVGPKGEELMAPWFLSIGNNIRELNPKDWRFVTNLLCRSILSTAKHYGIDPYLPAELGGFGLPNPKRNQRVKSRDSQLLTALHNHHEGKLLIGISCIGGDEFTSKMSGNLSADIECLRWYADGSTGVPLDDLWSVYSGRISAVHANKLFLQGVPRSKVSPKMTDFAKRLASKKHRLYESYSHVPPLRWTYADADILSSRLMPSSPSLRDLFCKTDPASGKLIGFKDRTPCWWRDPPVEGDEGDPPEMNLDTLRVLIGYTYMPGGHLCP